LRISFAVITSLPPLPQGMSGRALRKLPLKAHAFYVQRDEVDLTEFLQAMLLTIERDSDHSCIS
jgi:hypothetical protein